MDRTRSASRTPAHVSPELGPQPQRRDSGIGEIRPRAEALARADVRGIIAVAGLIASGKSTLAAYLGRSLRVPVVEADAVRARLRRKRPPVIPGAEPSEAAVYAAMLSRAAPVLAAGRAVVLDACFARQDERAAARRLADAYGVPFRLAECRLSDSERERRLTLRDRRDGLPAGSWLQLAVDLEARGEPPEELTAEQRLRVDGAAPVADSAARVEAWLARSAAAARHEAQP